MALIALFMVPACGLPLETCSPLPNPDAHLTLLGKLLDSGSADALAGIDVDARLLTRGEITTKEPRSFPTDEQGDFRLGLTTKGPSCPRALDLPTPDQLKVIVPLDECTQTFEFDITEENFLDLAFPDGIMELRNPILVPACEE